MTPQDREETRQMLSDILSGHIEHLNGRLNVIHSNLVNIETQTTKTNGRVTTIEGEIDKLKRSEMNHINLCPHTESINRLKESEVSRKAIFRFVGTLWIATVGLIGVIIAIYDDAVLNINYAEAGSVGLIIVDCANPSKFDFTVNFFYGENTPCIIYSDTNSNVFNLGGETVDYRFFIKFYVMGTRVLLETSSYDKI